MGASRRRVLMACPHAQPGGRLLASAMNLAGRMGAELEILLGGGPAALPAELQQRLEGWRSEGGNWLIEQRERLAASEVVRHANTHECIACVVIEAPESWGNATAWEKLACPLVAAGGKAEG